MPRNIYSSEHEDFRASVQEFVERTLKPRAEQMLEVKSIDRDIWKEAGSQGLFGLDIPVVAGTVLFSASLVLAANLLVDLLYGAIDPRVRHG